MAELLSGAALYPRRPEQVAISWLNPPLSQELQEIGNQLGINLRYSVQ